MTHCTSLPGPSCRLPALRRFAAAITILNVLGHFVLGFEQSWAQPLVALATAYAVELMLEGVGAWADGRRPQFLQGWVEAGDFLLPAHITALAVSMLLYANDRLWPIAFATALGIGSKAIVRVPVGRGVRHCLNPSNTGIAVTLLAFPWVGIAPPYQFTENLDGLGDWLLPTLIVLSGTFLNTRFTGKLPLIIGWIGGFLIQASLRSWAQGTPLAAACLPMSGMAFLLFTFYMVTDPATTPAAPSRQFAFGGSVAAVYGLLMAAHVVFGLFFSLLFVCSIRGLWLALSASVPAAARSRADARSSPSPSPARVSITASPVLEMAE